MPLCSSTLIGDTPVAKGPLSWEFHLSRLSAMSLSAYINAYKLTRQP
jgi:hypothetical protein